MPASIERRSVNVTELRVIRNDDVKPVIKGYAAVFNKLSEDMGFREKIEPGAFKNAIGKSDTRALWNHDSNYVLGRVSAGTLRLKEDDQGLYIENDPPDTQWARDLMVSIERGDVNQMSFGFIVDADRWEVVDGKDIRTIMSVRELADVSPVTFPAYPDTSVAMRSLEEHRAQAEENNDTPAPSDDGQAPEGPDDPTIMLGLRRRQLDLKLKENDFTEDFDNA